MATVGNGCDDEPEHECMNCYEPAPPGPGEEPDTWSAKTITVAIAI
jgi:hypothetical protein